MAILNNNESLMRECLQEYLQVANYCVEYRKPAIPGQRPGCLGYPAAVMLFSIVDTIGSFYQGSNDLMIEIGGKRRSIRGDAHQHFYVLNSEYYGQSLDEATFRKLYGNFRSLLVHNASLAPSHFLLNEPNEPDLFPRRNGSLCVKSLPIPRQVTRSHEAVSRTA